MYRLNVEVEELNLTQTLRMLYNSTSELSKQSLYFVTINFVTDLGIGLFTTKNITGLRLH